MLSKAIICYKFQLFMAFGSREINISIGIPPPLFCDFSLLLKVLINI